MSTLPSKKGYHHGDLREALLAAALAILEEHGDPAQLSLREAARRAGVSAMAPYRHFVDKDALLAAIATIGFEKLGSALRGAEAAAGNSALPQALLEAQGIAYVAFACRHPALFRVMFGASAPAKTGGLAEAANETFHVLADRVAQLVAPGVTSDVALAAWALVHGLAMLAVDGQLAKFDDEPDVLAARIVQLTFGNPVSQNATAEPSQAKKPPLSGADRPSTTSSR